MSITGIHHVTAIAGDPQRNLDFYTGLLGLRLVKRTVNFDDPYTWHLYHGDELGTPGTLMTFFPWPNGGARRPGTGQVAVTSFTIVPTSLGFWIERLLRFNVRYEGPSRRGSGDGVEQVIAFRDPDGVMIEIVAHPGAGSRPGRANVAGVPAEHSIRGLHAASLWVADGEETGRTLVERLGFRSMWEEGSTRRFTIGKGEPGTFVDVRSVGGFVEGRTGVGTVHHVAFAVVDDESQMALREVIADAGLHPTPVVDRMYFRSVYFREPGGVLFELATHRPGFTIDETVEHLGEELKLPPQLEGDRDRIVAALPPIHMPGPDSRRSSFADLTPGG